MDAVTAFLKALETFGLFVLCLLGAIFVARLIVAKYWYLPEDAPGMRHIQFVYLLQSGLNAVTIYALWVGGYERFFPAIIRDKPILASAIVFLLSYAAWNHLRSVALLKKAGSIAWDLLKLRIVQGFLLVAAIGFILFWHYRSTAQVSSTRPFVVYIDLKGQDLDRVEEAIKKLESSADETIQINTVLTPQDSDLEINLDVDCQEGDSEENELYWGWGTGDVHERLKMYLDEQNNVLGCDLDESLAVANELIRFSRGLELFHNRQKFPDSMASVAEAGEVFEELAHHLESELKDADKQSAGVINLRRRILTCAKVMSVIADGPALSQNGTEELTEVIDGRAFGDSQQPESFCLAQAYYWRGRDALQRHLNLPSNVASAKQDDEAGRSAGPALASPLEDALAYFDQAIFTFAKHKLNEDGVRYETACSTPDYSAVGDSEEGYYWIYYLFCGLAYYRQGDLVMAGASLDRAADSYKDSAINELPEAAIHYLHARIEWDGQIYQAVIDCENAVESEPTGGYSGGPVWQDMEALANGSSEVELLALVHTALHDPILQDLSELSGFDAPYSAPTSLEKLVDSLSHEPSGFDGLRTPSEVNPNDLKLLLNVVRARLYLLSEQPADATRTLRDFSSQDFFANVGAPAYVVALSPRLRPDAVCDPKISYDLSHPLTFLWMLHTSLDEPVFPFVWPDSQPEQKGSQFFMRLGAQDSANENIPLAEVGYGLFESAPVNEIATTLTARARPEGILLEGEAEAALVHMLDGVEQYRFPVGALRISTIADLRVVGHAKPVIQSGVEAGACTPNTTCPYEIGVGVTILAPGLKIEELQLGGSSVASGLALKAVLCEKRPDDPKWWPVSGNQVVLEHDRPDHFSGSFRAELPDSSEHTSYGVLIMLYDQNDLKVRSYDVFDLSP